MEICIVGTGASGWMSCSALRSLPFVTKIKIIGSPKIPTIGVGESTTQLFHDFLLKYSNLNNFIKKSDAAVKYGVYYKNWANVDFLHAFQSQKTFQRYGLSRKEYCELLSNKNSDIHLHQLVNKSLWTYCLNNQVCLNQNEYVLTWHFNAAKFINFLRDENLSDPKVQFISDEVVDCTFISEEKINYLTLETNQIIKCDYYINCTGENLKSQKIFKQDFEDLSKYLLTNKAIFYPLPFKNKKEEFHPYTVAKTMKCGWRWITPTWSRIGTGYVFSENHISVDEAINELKEDIGDKTINPHVVDFKPKAIKKMFHKNYCSIGMSAGFVEPLDAPGLAQTCKAITSLINLLKINDEDLLENEIKYHNYNNEYTWWMIFILTQYKTCYRSDSQFWIDQKNVNCPQYDTVMNIMNNMNDNDFEYYEWEMLYRTIAGKNINWKSRTDQKPFEVLEKNYATMHHLDFIKCYHNE